MKRKKRALLHFTISGIITASALWGSYLLLASSSDEFAPDKIRPSKHFSFQGTTGYSQKEIDTVKEIVSRPFYHWAERDDTYVFSSENNEYVIKFFKIRRLTPKYWLKYIPIPWLDKKRLDKIDKRERIRQEFFGGIKTAFEKFRHQNALVFLHMFRTDCLKTRITVIDANGKKHKIALDKVPFLIQKKAELLPDYLNRLVSGGEEEKAVQSLCRIFSLVKDGWEKGYVHTHEHPEIEYGFLEGEPIYIRNIYLPAEETGSRSEGLFQELLTEQKSLESWLQKHFPELVEPFREEASAITTLPED